MVSSVLLFHNSHDRGRIILTFGRSSCVTAADQAGMTRLSCGSLLPCERYPGAMLITPTHIIKQEGALNVVRSSRSSFSPVSLGNDARLGKSFCAQIGQEVFPSLYLMSCLMNPPLLKTPEGKDDSNSAGLVDAPVTEFEIREARECVDTGFRARLAYGPKPEDCFLGFLICQSLGQLVVYLLACQNASQLSSRVSLSVSALPSCRCHLCF